MTWPGQSPTQPRTTRRRPRAHRKASHWKLSPGRCAGRCWSWGVEQTLADQLIRVEGEKGQKGQKGEGTKGKGTGNEGGGKKGGGKKGKGKW